MEKTENDKVGFNVEMDEAGTFDVCSLKVVGINYNVGIFDYDYDYDYYDNDLRVYDYDECDYDDN